MGTAKSNKSSWVDKSVVDGITYKYTVRSVNGKMLSSYTASNEMMFLKTPELISAEKTTEGVVVTFEGNNKADSYRVYRKTQYTNWVLLAKTNDTVYTEKERMNALLTLFEKGVIDKKQLVARLPDGVIADKRQLLDEIARGDGSEGV